MLSKGLSGISVICSGYSSVLTFFLLHSYIFVYVSFYAFPIIMSFDEMISSVYPLVA